MTPEDVYGMDETSEFYRAQPNKTLSTRKSSGAEISKGPLHSCYKPNRRWEVETCVYSQISTPKDFWKVVLNKLCVVVCKPNGMDDMRCIWKLDDEPQCTFQILKAKGTFNHGIILLSMLVGVKHLDFQPYSWVILLLFSYHPMLQVWYNPWTTE